jgi:hypothetical protein
MSKSVDFSKGVRGKHVGTRLKVLGAGRHIWAVCLERNDKHLIPFKLYQIETFSDSDEVRLTNEKGLSKFYPKAWFVKVQISKQASGVLEKAI